MSSTALQADMQLIGHLTVTSIDADGVRTVVSDKKNQIVEGFLRTAAELISQQVTAPEELAIASMWMEASPTALLNPVTSSDIGPEGTVVKQYEFTAADIDTGVGGVDGLVEFRAVLDKADANGTIIRAAGLYTKGSILPTDPGLGNRGEVLVARQIFGSIPKDAGIALEFAWRIQFKIA